MSLMGKAEVYEFATIEEGIEDIRAGRLLLIADDKDRENECDLVMAAEKVTPEALNFMTMHGRGLICVPLMSDQLEALQIPMMVADNTAPLETAFTVSVDARHGVTTGISAHDRAITIRALVDPATRSDELTRPGHIFPLRAVPGGVLRRAGHTEAGVDLARQAGLRPAAVICEVLTNDGKMARVPDAIALGRKHGLKIITIRDLIEFRLRNEKLIWRVATTRLPNEYGEFMLTAYETSVDDNVPLALVLGDVAGNDPVLVRVHSECLMGDVFGSCRCDCGAQLHKSLQIIKEAGRGVLVYMRQEGRGIGLVNKLKACQLQDQGKDTIEANHALGFRADLRHYGIGAQILVDLGLKNLRILTNNPKKIVVIEGYGLRVVERLPIEIAATDANREYLRTKRDKLGHILSVISPRDRAS